jgi:hypothetical protein
MQVTWPEVSQYECRETKAQAGTNKSSFLFWAPCSAVLAEISKYWLTVRGEMQLIRILSSGVMNGQQLENGKYIGQCG